MKDHSTDAGRIAAAEEMNRAHRERFEGAMRSAMRDLAAAKTDAAEVSKTMKTKTEDDVRTNARLIARAGELLNADVPAQLKGSAREAFLAARHGNAAAVAAAYLMSEGVGRREANAAMLGAEPTEEQATKPAEPADLDAELAALGCSREDYEAMCAARDGGDHG